MKQNNNRDNLNRRKEFRRIRNRGIEIIKENRLSPDNIHDAIFIMWLDYWDEFNKNGVC